MSRSSDPAGEFAKSVAKRGVRRDRNAPERAGFLAGFPEDSSLAPAVAAFERGDYRSTRRICTELLERDLDPDVHDAARELLKRLEPDRLVLRVLWGSFVLLALIALWAYGQQ